MRWNDKTTVKKGNIGEEKVRKYLESNNKVIYKPITDSAHCFDNLVSTNKKDFVIVEVKTKPKRNYYPDTGIDYKHYLEYKEVSKLHSLPVYLFFVDEMIGKIYSGKLSDLDQPKEYIYKNKSFSYPKVESGIIYFYQPSMKVFCELTKDEIDSIKNFSSRNYNYQIE